MALRNQPYFPLYVQDFMTDERLMECSACTTGVYIRLLCVLHKSETYGELLLKQKDKQTDKQINNFAIKLAKFMPYDLQVILDAIDELVREGVVTIEGDILSQKRMSKDGKLSEVRALNGKKGGDNNKKNNFKKNGFATEFALAKTKANSENEIEDENEDKYFTNITLNEIFEKFLKNNKFEKTEDQIRLLIKKLESFPNDTHRIKSIENSIRAGYPDFYPLKEDESNGMVRKGVEYNSEKTEVLMDDGSWEKMTAGEIAIATTDEYHLPNQIIRK